MKTQPRLDLEPLLLRGEEVAEVLGCSRALAYQWMAANRIPTVRVPGSRTIRVPRAALLKWIEEHTEQPRDGAAA
ncbi:MAG: helix-turn-helix domain-containing protein [Bryobacteraceae bacterium]|jgi:excisionase family DNA binding protein